MKNIELYVPSEKDLWFREQCMSDPKTMNYNAGYSVSYAGYHYETGCIDFPKERWSEWVKEKLENPNFFYAYIRDNDLKSFVGYVNFNLNPETKKATMGIVVKNEFQGRGYMRPALNLLIEAAKNKGVHFLTDTVPKTRERALKVFFDLGFKKTNEFVGKKFNKDEVVFEIEKKL